MKYINYFASETDFNTARNENYLEPWLSCIEDVDGVVYNKTDYEIYFEKFFTIEVISGGTFIIKTSNSIANSTVGWDSNKAVKYSKDNGLTWPYKFVQMNETFKLNLDAGDIVMFKGYPGSGNENEVDGIWSSEPFKGTSFYTYITGTATFNAYGNLGSLVFNDNFKTAVYDFYGEDTNSTCFSKFFKTSGLVSAENLILPKNGKYVNMFSDTAIKPKYEY